MNSDTNKKPVQVLLTPKYIIYTGKVLSAISPFLASRFAASLFLTPFKYKLPKREKEMDKKSFQSNIMIPNIKKEIIVYPYGNSSRKVLLVHGWSGRGTQMAVLAKHLLNHGWEIISFDAPAHGKAPGKKSMMAYFIESIWHLNSIYGPFDAAIGHSLGGMSLLKTAKDGLPLKKLVVIGTGNSITHITRNFIKNLQLKKEIAIKMKDYFEKKFGEKMNTYSGAISAKSVAVPTLVVHDENDVDVDVSSAYEINEALQNGELYITKNLGHRKILGDASVINKITTFITV